MNSWQIVADYISGGSTAGPVTVERDDAFYFDIPLEFGPYHFNFSYARNSVKEILEDEHLTYLGRYPRVHRLSNKGWVTVPITYKEFPSTGTLYKYRSIIPDESTEYSLWSTLVQGIVTFAKVIRISVPWVPESAFYGDATFSIHLNIFPMPI